VQRVRLLVSVRDAHEAQLALAGGADLIDVKEPSAGSLGAAEPATIAAVLDSVAGRVPVSAALGELFGDASSRVDPRRLDPRVRFAKVGLAGAARRADWREVWRAALGQLPSGVASVAVVYADWQKINAPSPGELLAATAELGCAAVLVDTFDKSAGHLLDHWPAADLIAFLDEVRRNGRLAVVGGSVTAKLVPTIAAFRPDYIAVRGAVCSGERTAALDAERVADFAGILRAVHD
jgi:uncharacterized protein (UPF0264 family)